MRREGKRWTLQRKRIGRRKARKQRKQEVRQWEDRLREEGSDGDLKQMAELLVQRGIPIDFELPYPEPRNEYEEAWNWVHLNPVISGRADW
jgi:hypothetical protein